jgi:hypothetical protein
MFVTRINISRDGYFGYGSKPDATKEFRASIEVLGQYGKVELNLAPDLSKRIIEIIADEVVVAGRKTAEAMTADVLSVKALTTAA